MSISIQATCDISAIEEKVREYSETIGIEPDLILMSPDVFSDFNKSLMPNIRMSGAALPPTAGIVVSRMHTSMGTVDLKVVQGWPPGTWKVSRSGQEDTNIEKLLFDKITQEFEELVFNE